MKVSLIMTGKGAGGLQQAFFLYTIALLQAGHSVQAFVYRKSPFVNKLTELGLQPEIVSFHSWHRWRKLSIPLMWWKLRRFSPDVVVGFAQKGLKVARAAVGRKCPLVTHIGSLDPILLTKLAIADGYIATSEQMSEVLVQVGVDQSQIRRLPNFLISPLQPPKQVAFGAPVYIGSMGRFVERKGFSTLLEAGRQLRAHGLNIRIVLAGDGPDRQKLRDEAQALGIADIVDFPGWLDDKSKMELLLKTDIFVCPSNYEPFGIVLIEAAHAGLPVVTTDTNGARQIFQDEIDALFSPIGDAGAIAAQIERLIRNPALAQAIADRGSETFRQKFHVSEVGPQLAEILTDMIRQWREARVETYTVAK